jgi:hypothetical protein
VAGRVSELIDLAPDVSATVTADDGVLARLALWLADVSAESAQIALPDPVDPDSPAEPE